MDPADKGGEHASRVQRMFDRIAPVYDLMNHVLSLGQDIRWRRKAVGDFARGGPELVIDACGGTGDLSLALRRRAPETRIVLADYSREMLRRSLPKCRGRGIPPVACDALRLPFGDGCADGVMCAFGVRNLRNLRAGIQEFARVLRPGGRLLILEFVPSQRGLLSAVANGYVRRIVPRIGRFLSRDASAYTYLPDSVAAFVTLEELSTMLKEEGFHLLRTRQFSLGVTAELLAERQRQTE